MALKSSIANRMTSNSSFCKRHTYLLVSQYLIFLYLFDEFLLLSQNKYYGAGFEVIERRFVPSCIRGYVISGFILPHISALIAVSQKTLLLLLL
jgi:hypothetical protein